MPCERCDGELVCLAVPESIREQVAAPSLAVCSICLTVTETAESPSSEPGDVSGALPSDLEQAIPVLCLVDALSSLATNRDRIETLVAITERAGCDPLLVIDRLIDDPSLEPALDLPRRRHQLEDMLY